MILYSQRAKTHERVSLIFVLVLVNADSSSSKSDLRRRDYLPVNLWCLPIQLEVQPPAPLKPDTFVSTLIYRNALLS